LERKHRGAARKHVIEDARPCERTDQVEQIVGIETAGTTQYGCSRLELLFDLLGPVRA
jgi:hypothetical protein